MGYNTQNRKGYFLIIVYGISGVTWGHIQPLSGQRLHQWQHTHTHTHTQQKQGLCLDIRAYDNLRHMYPIRWSSHLSTRRKCPTLRVTLYTTDFFTRHLQSLIYLWHRFLTPRTVATLPENNSGCHIFGESDTAEERSVVTLYPDEWHTALKSQRNYAITRHFVAAEHWYERVTDL